MKETPPRLRPKPKLRLTSNEPDKFDGDLRELLINGTMGLTPGLDKFTTVPFKDSITEYSQYLNIRGTYRQFKKKELEKLSDDKLLELYNMTKEYWDDKDYMDDCLERM